MQDDSINLQQVVFDPDNILDLFARFGVPGEFDLLSIDADKVRRPIPPSGLIFVDQNRPLRWGLSIFLACFILPLGPPNSEECRNVTFRRHHSLQCAQTTGILLSDKRRSCLQSQHPIAYLKSLLLSPLPTDRRLSHGPHPQSGHVPTESHRRRAEPQLFGQRRLLSLRSAPLHSLKARRPRRCVRDPWMYTSGTRT